LLLSFSDKERSDKPKAIAKLYCVPYFSTIFPDNFEKSLVIAFPPVYLLLKYFEQIHSNSSFNFCQPKNSSFLNFFLEFLFKILYNEIMEL